MTKLIIGFSDVDLFPNKKEVVREGYAVRIAARAVIRNTKGEIAVMHMTKTGMHKLPGGGVEENETVAEGMKREIMEETGLVAEVNECLGLTLEYRDEWKMMQISHCHFCTLTGEAGKTNLTEEEKERGFELVWMPIKKMIEILEKYSTTNYDEMFMRKRELAILKEAEKS